MNLGVLLNYRSQVEEALRTELSGMQGVLHEAEAVVRELEGLAEKESIQYLVDVQAGLAAEEVVGRQGELEALADRIRRAKAAVLESQQRCGEKLGEVLAAAQERRKLELLDARRQRRVESDANRQEQHDLDELAGRRYLAERRNNSTAEEGGEGHEG